MLTIGFANHYFTLWSVTETESWNSERKLTYITTHYSYFQNLSMELEAAKDKAAEMAGEAGYEIDLTLRGQNGRYYTKTRISNLEPWRFSFGKLLGEDIRESSDIWQLKRAMVSEAGCRRKAYARRRLIELGELVRYEWTETITKWVDVLVDGYYNHSDPIKTTIVRQYCPVKLRDAIELSKKGGHFFENGKRVTINIKEISSKSFDSQFGTVYVVKYLTDDDKVVEYKGGTPPEISDNDFTTVKGTIKHDEYKERKRTLLQRIKVETHS